MVDDPKICLNCKHWGGLTGSGPRSECRRIVGVVGDDGSEAAVLESRGYDDDGGALCTKFDFGCLLFEAKE